MAVVEVKHACDKHEIVDGATVENGNKGEHLSYTSDLVHFLQQMSFPSLPEEVILRTEDLFVDYICCALAGARHTPLAAYERFAKAMGPSEGRCDILSPSTSAEPKSTSAYFAAMLNAAASHLVEQDDLHMASVVHPATVIFPATLAAAQDQGSSGKEFLVASVVGYEVACRVGEMLGRKHYSIFHTTGTAGTVGAAAAVAKLLGLSHAQMLDAMGTAGTQAAGLFQYSADAAMSKQVHTAHAASTGLLSAYTAREGLTGAKDILLGKLGLAKATAFGDEDPAALVRGLGREWKVTETSFKWHASCRHTHPAADALQAIVRRHGVQPGDIASITAHVYADALRLRTRERARSVHESKFSMGFVLALIAVKGRASISDFTTEALEDEEVRRIQSLVRMQLDPKCEEAYPRRWSARVQLRTLEGQTWEEEVHVARGDPPAALSRREITEKGVALAKFGRSSLLQGERLRKLFEDVWSLDTLDDMSKLLT